MLRRLAVAVADRWPSRSPRRLQHGRRRRQGREGRRAGDRERRRQVEAEVAHAAHRHASISRPHRTRRAARPRQRRHRRDHPQAVPEVDQAVGLRPEPVRRVALSRPRRAGDGQREAAAQPGFRAERAALPGRVDPARAPQLRLRQLARARAVGAARLRLPRADRAVVRRHLLQQLLQERPAADRAAGGARSTACSPTRSRSPASS